MRPARLTLPGRGCGTENLASSRNWPPLASPRATPDPHRRSCPCRRRTATRNGLSVSPAGATAITRSGRSPPARRMRLAVPHSLVRPAGVAELPVGAPLGDPPVVEDHNLIDLV